MKEKFQIGPYVVEGARSYKEAVAAIDTAFKTGKLSSRSRSGVIKVADQKIQVSASKDLVEMPLTTVIKNSRGKDIEIPRYQFR